MAKVGKRLRKIYEAVDREKLYALDEALKLVKTNASAKFNETIEVNINLNIDTRKSDQTVRGIVALPHGTGKSIRIAVFARGDKAEAAKKAGADTVGAEDLMEAMQGGDLNYDRVIATPDMMAVVGRLGKVLGPKGLMPNPKLGTVTPNVEEAVKAAKAGQVEYRAEKAGIVQAGIGKASFSETQLKENLQALYDAVLKAKPSDVKGSYIKRLGVSSTMGVGIKVDVASIVG